MSKNGRTDASRVRPAQRSKSLKVATSDRVVSFGDECSRHDNSGTWEGVNCFGVESSFSEQGSQATLRIRQRGVGGSEDRCELRGVQNEALSDARSESKPWSAERAESDIGRDRAFSMTPQKALHARDAKCACPVGVEAEVEKIPEERLIVSEVGQIGSESEEELAQTVRLASQVFPR